jgi:acyl carrier protein
MEEKIRQYIIKELLHNKKMDLPAGRSLIGAGILDSLSFLQLISFVEEEFGVKVENEEMQLEYFESIAAITAFIQKKQSSIRS